MMEELKLGFHKIEIQEQIKKELFYFWNSNLEYVDKMRKYFFKEAKRLTVNLIVFMALHSS